MKKLFALVAVSGMVLGAALTGASALPKYAEKEKLTCTSCHVKPEGGMPLNARGQYYRSHGHSLKGYTPAKGK